MTAIRKFLERSPIHARVVPFAIFLVLTFCQGQFGVQSGYWFYVAKTIVGAWLVWESRSLVSEMRWALSWEAVLVGVIVFAMWVGLDSYFPKIDAKKLGDNPFALFSSTPGLAWFFVLVHLIGMTVVVPPLEEVVYRSFLYRYLVKQDFLSVSLTQVSWFSLLVTSLIFGFEHNEWLSGLLCGLLYQGLVLRKGRLGDAITAHAITNFLLGAWVIYKGAWNFW